MHRALSIMGLIPGLLLPRLGSVWHTSHRTSHSIVCISVVHVQLHLPSWDQGNFCSKNYACPQMMVFYLLKISKVYARDSKEESRTVRTVATSLKYLCCWEKSSGLSTIRISLQYTSQQKALAFSSLLVPLSSCLLP